MHDNIDLPQVFHLQFGRLCAAGNVPSSDLVQLVAAIARQAAANKRVDEE